MGVTLSPQQNDAVDTFAKWWDETGKDAKSFESDADAPFFCQQGFAGTGKTTILPYFIEKVGLDPFADVTFIAPTGKAAKVMTTKLAAQGIRKQATTIHKAIYRPKGLKFYAIEAQVADTTRKLHEATTREERIALQKTLKMLQKDLERAYDTSSPMFQLNPDSPVMRQSKLIVVDEASMVGERIVSDLVSFGTPILAIGDPGQLPPVGDAPGFFIRKPDHMLTEIHRQALDNPIIWASKLIRDGKDVPMGSHGDGLLRVVSKREDDVTYDTSRDVQIIVGRNETRHRMTRKLRKLCGLDAAGPTTGELMIVTRNSRKHPNLVNGTMLMVTNDSGDLKAGNIICKVYAQDEDKMPYELNCIQGILEENYLGKNEWTASKGSVRNAMEQENNHLVDWAYVITCHKSQGSQWDDVCVHDESGTFRDDARKWLYTAVTRAAKTLTLVV